MKLLGIWQENCSYTTMKKLRTQGFTVAFLDMEYFYKRNEKMFDTVEKIQKMAAVNMYQAYKYCWDMGYSKIIIDFGWGMGKFDNNYFYRVVFDIFTSEGYDKSKVVWYLGEPIETFYEAGLLSNAHLKELMNERTLMTDGNIVHDATVRNYNTAIKEFGKNFSISSYFCQMRKWNSFMPWVWVTGNMGWEMLFGAFNYGKHANMAKFHGIPMAMLWNKRIKRWWHIFLTDKFLKDNDTRNRKAFLKAFGDYNA